jgi:tRNA pseudouridine38-40 synthase
MATEGGHPARRFKAVVSYDGTNYSGYQIQPGHPTIQEKLEAAIRETCGQAVRVFSSGRTDQGVHARGQVIHFDVSTKTPTDKLARALNAVLPRDIRIESLRPAPAAFDARKSATGKEYRYFIFNQPVLTPDVRLYRAHVWRPLDVQAMQRAAARLVGRHDFAAFTANPRREVDGTVRHLRELRVRKSGSEIVIVARGDGFLYRMVRSLAGFLIRVGLDELGPQDAVRILHSKTRTAAVPTADPQGLYLWKVFYRRCPPYSRPSESIPSHGDTRYNSSYLSRS